MPIYMEDMSIAAQEELHSVRNAIDGWEPGTHATPEQWMVFYSLLGFEGQNFLVTNLLELAQQGSLCQQADHHASIEASWNQLTQVVKLHNARVDEVTMLRVQLSRLTEILTGHVSATQIAAALAASEREAFPARVVEPQLPEDKEFLPVNFDGQVPTDRVLYVVRNPPEVEDGETT